ncbi:MAG: hypothetical protein BroJett026_14280 [Betaproteobacteria bacterium]|nr:MAG: hypothetical protein BroJett026_14280 [Betaproteobacteria bacterium]
MTRFVVATLAIVGACVLQGGCAQTEAKEEGRAWSAPVTRTGSNLPVGREREQKPAEMTEAERRQLESQVELGRIRRGTGN